MIQINDVLYNPSMRHTRSHFVTIFWLLITASFLSGPIAVGWVGTYIRFSGDDYCYASALKTGGFINGQINSFSMIRRFNGERYSLTLMNFITELFGPKGNAAAIIFIVLLFSIGLFLFTMLFLKTARVVPAWKPALAISSLIAFFTYLTFPDLYPAVYWVTAMHTYFTPVVFLIWLSATILFLLQKERLKPSTLLLLFITTLIFGAFSEVTTVLQISWLTMFAVFAWQIRRRNFWLQAYKVFLVTILASLISLIVMLLSPYSAHFFTSLIEPQQIDDLIFGILLNAARYNLNPGQGYTTPFLVEVFILGLIGYLLRADSSESYKGSGSFAMKMIPVISFFGWLLIAATFFPTHLVLKTNPSTRAIMPAHVIRQMEYALISLTTGWAIYDLLHKLKFILPLHRFWVPLAILLASLYPIRGTPYLLTKEAFMRKWSLLWDQRDAQIREAVANGETQIEVMMLDHPIPWLAELGDDPTSDYNQCAQEYYGIQAIIADQPGWDSFKLP